MRNDVLIIENTIVFQGVAVGYLKSEYEIPSTLLEDFKQRIGAERHYHPRLFAARKMKLPL